MTEDAFPELPVYCAKGARGIRVAGRLVHDVEKGEEGGSELQLLFREGDLRGAGAGAVVAEGGVPEGLRFFVALEGEEGSCVVPYGTGTHGSTIYLPFQAARIVWFDASGAGHKALRIHQQRWMGWRWGEVESRRGERLEEFIRPGALGELTLAFPPQNGSGAARFVVYAKLMQENSGWGELVMASSRSLAVALERGGGRGDYYLPSSLSIEEHDGQPHVVEHFPEQRKIYLLFPRLFNNPQDDLIVNGGRERNGCGRWNGITPAALESLRAMGFTDIWLMGVLQHATGSAYPEAGLPADVPDLVKGVAGSPYAVKNPVDLSPECAQEPEKRLEEFRALLGRIHAAGLRAIIDFVPNHLARCYLSHALKGKIRIGTGDDVTRFFSPSNTFYYIQEQGGLRLPTVNAAGEPMTETCRAVGGCTGRYEREQAFARVSGNNVTSAAPSLNDWYETVKLNYGLNFVTDEACFPSSTMPEERVPPLWQLMDSVLAFWQEQGVDGFRCDMAHLVPPEFWMWAIRRARQRAQQQGRGGASFIAEAYDNDPMRVASRSSLLQSLYEGRGNVGVNLVDAGFDLVYDDAAYKKAKSIYDGASWANDLDACFTASPLLAAHGLRYAENHDEVRLASAGNWGGIGKNVGRPVCAILYGATPGGVLLYNGQEVGEAGSEPAGYGGGDGRTTIFDYWSMPELQKWVNNGEYDAERLSNDQQALRASYGRLLALLSRPAFSRGLFLPLNEANRESAQFGRLAGEAVSGHWMYAFLRYDAVTSELFLVVVNLHAREAFRNVEVLIPGETLELVGLTAGEVVRLEDCLSSQPPLVLKCSAAVVEIPVVPPLTPYYFEVKKGTT